MPTAVAKKKPAAKPSKASTDVDRDFALIQKKEPLHTALRPYLEKTNTVLGTILKHPFYVGPVNPQHAAMAHEVITTRQTLLEKSIEAGQWGNALSLYEHQFLLDGFLEHAENFDDATFWKLFGYTWRNQEQVWTNRKVFLTFFQANRPGREALMDEDEQEALRNLPDEFPLYRGFQGRGAKGISWTTDREKAVWFANRFAMLDHLGEPKLLTGVARKEDVLGHFLGRGESEVVIDPAKVKKQNVTEAVVAKPAKNAAKKATKSAVEKRTSRYITHVPKTIPVGKILCHGGVIPQTSDQKPAVNGFRPWFDDDIQSAQYGPCNCGWSGLPHYMPLAWLEGDRKEYDARYFPRK